MLKRKAKAVVFTTKCRIWRLIWAKDNADIVDSGIAMLQRRVHLKLYSARSQIIEIVCSEKVTPTLTLCTMEVVGLYTEMYRSCMIGKKFAIFEQQWFKHLEQYFSNIPLWVTLLLYCRPMRLNVQVWCTSSYKGAKNSCNVCLPYAWKKYELYIYNWKKWQTSPVKR